MLSQSSLKAHYDYRSSSEDFVNIDGTNVRLHADSSESIFKLVVLSACGTKRIHCKSKGQAANRPES
jgi:hypothetical protein